ncbi:MAG: hypothetical protein FWD21_04850 [Peptococcaceae bacterium]|nr:hypothetical protein [Peptococcaceae bacterium]
MKKILSLLFTMIFAVSISCNEVNTTEKIPSSDYSNDIKAAEQSVLDFFASAPNNDYDTYDRVSMNKYLSDEVRRNTFELQQDLGVFAEMLTILSSERCSEDMVMVSVSYTLDGIDFQSTYTVVKVDNRWVLDLSDRLDPSKSNVIPLTPIVIPVTPISMTISMKYIAMGQFIRLV